MAYYLTNPIKLDGVNVRLFGDNSYLTVALTDPEDKTTLIKYRVKPYLRYTKDDIGAIYKYIEDKLTKVKTIEIKLSQEDINQLINELLSLRTNETNYNKDGFTSDQLRIIKYWEDSLESDRNKQGNTRDLDGQILLISKDISMSGRVMDLEGFYKFWLLYNSNNEYVLFVNDIDKNETKTFRIKSKARPNELEENKNDKFKKELDELETLISNTLVNPENITNNIIEDVKRIKAYLVQNLNLGFSDNIKNNELIKDSIKEDETINLFISLEIDKKIPSELKIHIINNEFSLIKTSDKLAIYENETKKYFIFNEIDEIPDEIIYNIEIRELQQAIRGHSKELDNNIIDKNILDLILYTENKPQLYMELSDKEQSLVMIKKQLENYYKIKVNADDINKKYYYNYQTRKYELINILRFGFLIETEHGVTLSETDLNNVYKMFRNVQQPNNDAIAFNNCVLDTTNFKELPLDTFTIKQLPFNYRPLSDFKETTLIEETLKKILIPANAPDNTKLYEDFLQRVGASFKRENIHKIINFYNGSGDDGKSTLLKILSFVHCDLSIFLKPENLKDDSFITNLSNLNVMLMEELNKNSLKGDIVELIKDMSGRGQRDVRRMYTQETQKVKDFGVFFIATNILPFVDFSNKAYWERANIIKVPNKFDNYEDLDNNIYLADPDIESKLAQDTDGLEWLISASIDAYAKRPNNEFTIKQSALETQFIYDGVNPIRIFIETFIIETDNKEDIISNKEIVLYLLRWAKQKEITKKDLGVYTMGELSQEIGAKLKNQFKDIEERKQKNGKHGATAYRSLALNIDGFEELTTPDLKIELEILESEYF